MRKQVSALLASMLLAGGLMLPACGGGNSAQDTSNASEAATEEVQEVKEDPAKKFIGEWRLAAAESNGVTMAGDLSIMLGEDVSFTFTLNEDGTGNFAFSEEKANLTWKLKTI